LFLYDTVGVFTCGKHRNIHLEPFSDEQIVSFPVSAFYPDASLAALSGLPSLWVWELRVSERS
jgi:hypothetical protein